MLLVGRESVPENTGFEMLTFECECGKITTSVVTPSCTAATRWYVRRTG